MKVMCILKRGDWLDDKIDCDIKVYKNHGGLAADGFIKTSKPLPIEDTISYIVDKEIFELWFEKPIEGADGLKIMLEDIDWKTKRSTRFKPVGALYKKEKK